LQAYAHARAQAQAQAQAQTQTRQALQIKAWAKVNLALSIVAKRPDGYHDIETVMHRIDLADEIEVVRGSSCVDAGIPAVTVEVTGVEGVDISGVPCDGRNVAFRAAQAFLKPLESPGTDCSVGISIRKRIPVGAGLGGGSADAAAVLAAMNQLWGKPYGREQLIAIAASTGADVPFCLMNHDLAGCGDDCCTPVIAAFARGVGDRLTPLPALRGVGMLLVNPGFAVSTSDAYAMWDARLVEGFEYVGDTPSRCNAVRPEARSTARLLAEALRSAQQRAGSAHADDDLRRICSLMSNDFEPLIAERHGQIMQIKQLMMQAGAIGALMSGSGPTVFGVYGSPGKARAAADALRSLASASGLDVSRDGFCVIAGCIGGSGS